MKKRLYENVEDLETVEKSKKVQTDFDSPLNPRYSAGIDVDLTNPTSVNAFYEGDSLDAHRQVEEGNEHIAKDEIGQQMENL